jgi:hypothetical protein
MRQIIKGTSSCQLGLTKLFPPHKKVLVIAKFMYTKRGALALTNATEIEDPGSKTSRLLGSIKTMLILVRIDCECERMENRGFCFKNS